MTDLDDRRSDRLGVLMVRVIQGHDLLNKDTGIGGDVSDPYVKVCLGGEIQKTRTINNDCNPKWDSEPFHFDVFSSEEVLELVVMDANTITSDSFLGRLKVPLESLISNPDVLIKSQEDLQEVRKGQLEVEVCYTPDAPPNNVFSALGFSSEDKERRPGIGCLTVRIIAGHNLKNVDLGVFGDVSDPYVRLSFGGVQHKTNTINNDLNPRWNSDPFHFDVYEDTQVLELKVMDKNIMSDKPLGIYELPVSTLIAKAGEKLMFQEDLQGVDRGQLEFEASFESYGKDTFRCKELCSCCKSLADWWSGKPNDDPLLAAKGDDRLGVLSVRVVRAYNLPNVDTGIAGDVSDAYVKVTCGETTHRTQTINNNLNPKWNAGPFHFDIYSVDDVVKMSVYDSNSITKDDFIGSLKMRVKEFVDNPGSAIMSQQSLKSDDRPKCGELEVEISFEPDASQRKTWCSSLKECFCGLCFCCAKKPEADGAEDPLMADPLLQEQFSDPLSSRIGFLAVHVVAAYDLVNKDTGIAGDVSDPYVKLCWGSKEYTTRTVNNNLNPRWNQGPFHFDVKDKSEILELAVMDKNTISSDKFLGGMDVHVKDLVGKAGQPVTIRQHLLQTKRGELEIKALCMLDKKPFHQGSGSPCGVSFSNFTEWVENPEHCFGPPQGIGDLSVMVVAAKNLVIRDTGASGGVSDHYVKLSLGSINKRTRAVHCNLNPRWDSGLFVFRVLGADQILQLSVLDESAKTGANFIGLMEVPIEDLLGKRGRPMRVNERLLFSEIAPNAELEIELSFQEAADADAFDEEEPHDEGICGFVSPAHCLVHAVDGMCGMHPSHHRKAPLAPADALHNRVFTDTGCCIISAFLWILIIIAAVLAAKSGDPRKLIHGFDYQGRICGVDPAVADRGMLYWPDPTHAQHPVCVSSCPTDTSQKIPCHTDMVSATNSSEGGETTTIITAVSDVSSYPSKPVRGKYCLPLDPSLDSDVKRMIHSEAKGPVAHVLENIAELQAASPLLLLILPCTFLVGYFFLHMLSVAAEPILWMSLFVLEILLVMLAVFCFRAAEYPAGELIGQHIGGDSAEEACWWAGVICVVLAVCVLLVCVGLRRSIRPAVACVTVASEITWQMPSVRTMAFLEVTFNVIFIAAWVTHFCWVISSGTLSGDSLRFEGVTVAGFNRRFQYTDTQIVMLIVCVIGGVWGLGIISALFHFATAYLVARWYFTEIDGAKKTPLTLRRTAGIWVAIRYHLGSLALGGALVGPSAPLRLFFDYLSTQGPSTNGLAGLLLRPCWCCIDCFEKLLCFLDEAAYVEIAIHSDGFFPSGKQVVAVLGSDFAEVAALRGICFIFSSVGTSCIVVLITLLSMFCITTLPVFTAEDSKFLVTNPVLVSMVCGVLAFIIGKAFMSVLDIVAEALVYCALSDRLHQQSQVSFVPRSPVYEPPQLKPLIDDHGTKIARQNPTPPRHTSPVRDLGRPERL